MNNIFKGIWSFILFLFGGRYPQKRKVSSITAQKIQQKWKESVVLALKTRNPAQLRQALVTADKLLDTALGEIADGENMSSRLKSAQDLFPWEMYNKLWQAHKVRNSLVHDLDYEPTYFVLEEAIGNLKMGLIEIGIQL